MTGANLRRVHAGLLLLAVMLSACGGEAAQPAAANSAAPAKSAVQLKTGPSPQELTAGMVEAAELDKAALPINLKFELGSKPKIGTPLEIDLALLSKIPLASAEVEVTSAEGFEVPAGAAHFEVPETDTHDVFRHTLRVKPLVDGVLFVALTVSSKHDDLVETKAFSIPVIVER